MLYPGNRESLSGEVQEEIRYNTRRIVDRMLRADIRRAQMRKAQEAIRKAGVELSDDHLRQCDGGAYYFTDSTCTDQAIINSLEFFAHLYATVREAPFFINMSWTIPRYTFDLAPEPDAFGATVAAVGNHSKLDVFASETMYAYRSRETPGDVLSVMSIDSVTGRPNCASSQWTANPSFKVFGFAYSGPGPEGVCSAQVPISGEIAGPPVEGTSFAAARVSFLLAFREAFRQPTVDSAAQKRWFIDFRKRVLSLQDANSKDFKRYWLDVRKLFSNAAERD